MLKVGSGGQFCRPRKPSRFDGLVDATPSSSSSESSDSGSITTTEETLYKHYLQVIYTPVSSIFFLMRYFTNNHIQFIVIGKMQLNIIEVFHYCLKFSVSSQYDIIYSI